jgi:hypothetical protein
VLLPSQSIYDYVLECVFSVYLSNPKTLKRRLDMAETAMVITSQGLQFSLPQIYAFACLETQQTQQQSYQSFRSCLYGQQTQVKLRALGGEVVIACNQQNINESLYQLQALQVK